jgi:hypothetical protein
MLLLKSIQPDCLLRISQTWLRPLYQFEEEGRMPLLGSGPSSPPRQAFPALLAQGLQHPIAWLPASSLCDRDERLVQQPTQQVKYIRWGNRIIRTRCLGCLEGLASGEHSQPLE